MFAREFLMTDMIWRAGDIFVNFLVLNFGQKWVLAWPNRDKNFFGLFDVPYPDRNFMGNSESGLMSSLDKRIHFY
jgi:hypothetical protein